jgi:phosphohistidine phosphatase
MVVGHNPGLEGLVATLTGEHLSLPTAALVECTMQIQTFASLFGATGQLGRVFHAKDD